MLLHDTMLKHDSYKTGTFDTPQCDCGMAAETDEHFLLHCSKYYDERQEMLNSINDIVCSPKYVFQKICYSHRQQVMVLAKKTTYLSKKHSSSFWPK